MTISDAVSISDQHQIPVRGKTNLHYNSNNELIWISYEYASKTKWQKVSDDSYIGATDKTDITRTKTFWYWEDA